MHEFLDGGCTVRISFSNIHRRFVPRIEGHLRKLSNRIRGNPQFDSWRRVVRDIFGNPFRPAAVDPAWLRWNDGTAVAIAQKMYDDRDFTSMPVLADALEEAGCTNADILEHCRRPGEHVRGCWVVDLLLRKE